MPYLTGTVGRGFLTGTTSLATLTSCVTSAVGRMDSGISVRVRSQSGTNCRIPPATSSDLPTICSISTRREYGGRRSREKMQCDLPLFTYECHPMGAGRAPVWLNNLGAAAFAD